MRRRRQRIIGPAVSLFPFLAVLICTLGVLIVLLVLAAESANTHKANREHARNAQAESQRREQVAALALAQQQQSQRRAEQLVAIEALADQVDRHEVEAEAFEADRERIRRDVAHARDYRAHLESELKSLAKEARSLASQIELLDRDLLDEDALVEDEAIERLREQVATAVRRLEEKRANTVLVTEKKYAIVPYHGSGGTGRVPVFIECDAQGLVLRPWNIRIAKQEFFRPVTAGNPVDAALAAVKGYFNEHQLSSRDQRPYPLLVVRPGGAQAYGLARRALVSWDDEFGYELVGEEKELDFGEVDSQLQDEVAAAVEKSKQLQLALMRRGSGRGGYANGSSGSRFASGNEGGLSGSSLNGFDPSSPASSPSGEAVGDGAAGEFASNGGDFKSAESGSADGGRSESISGGEFRQASFAAGGSHDEAQSIKSSFQSGSVSHANGSFIGAAEQSSQGPSQIGSSMPSQSLASERGSNWALPTETHGATGYVRPVSLRCRGDSVVIKDVAGKPVSIEVGSDDTEAIDQLINIVWQRIDSWGVAGSNAFWKPYLVVDVDGDLQAGLVFAKLKQRLKNSGLEIEEATR